MERGCSGRPVLHRGKASQTITFGPLPNKTYGDAPFTLSATASSGLAVSFSIVSGPATVSGNMLTITGAGAVTVRASQSGDTNWNAASPVYQFFNVAKANQTITFGTLPDKTYGDAPFTLSASASSALAVTFSVVSGPSSISNLPSPTLTLTGSGGVTLQASQSGDANWNAATPVYQFFNIAQATITVTANSLTRVYGAQNPPLTITYSGFAYGQTSNVFSGSPSLSTTATVNSPVAGSPYPIAVTQGTLSASNYNFSFVAGQLRITPASVVGTLISSANPSPSGSNVTFTARLSAVAPSTLLPAGTVRFTADGLSLNSPVALANGVASLTTSALAQGTHTISAEYISDGNFSGNTNQIVVIVNAAATASAAKLLGINPLTGGMQITFAGSPGYTYHVERTADLQGSNTLWQALGQTAVNDAGQGQFTDTNPPQQRACYRVVWP